MRALLLGAKLLRLWDEYTAAVEAAPAGPAEQPEAAASQLEPALLALGECWKVQDTRDVIHQLVEVSERCCG